MESSDRLDASTKRCRRHKLAAIYFTAAIARITDRDV